MITTVTRGVPALAAEASRQDSTAQPGAPGLNLPAAKYALVLRLHTSPSAILVADSGNLPCSRSLPCEIFPGTDTFSNEETFTASREAIERTGLAGVFEPDPSEAVRSISLSDGTSAIGSLLVMGPSARMPQTVKQIHRNCSAELNALVARAKGIAIQYEWEILKHAFRSPSPCVVADKGRRIVSANNILCDMLGRPADEIIGTSLDDLVHFEREATGEIPLNPECLEITTPLFIKPLFLFFISNVGVTRLSTVCGERTMYVLQDIYTDRRAGNSNILLIQKVSGMVLSDGPPQAVIRRLINLLTLTLSCELVCVLQRKAKDEMLVTPYSNKPLDTLKATVIESANEPLLQPLFASGSPVFCDSIETACTETSFFRQVADLGRFALLPIGDGASFEHAVLAAWSRRDTGLGPEAMPLLRIIGNQIGFVLAHLRLSTENDQEKDALRRYTRLTAGRECRMAEIKRENAQLRSLLAGLGAGEKE